MTPRIRPYHSGDSDTLFAIFVDAVRNGTGEYYDNDQRRAWAPATTPPSDWSARLGACDTYVALFEGEIAGFIATTADGYVDLAFVRPALARRGVGQALYDAMLARARSRGLTALTTHASHLAKPFFARNGWRVETTELIERNGATLERFAMALDLSPLR
ncbi:GNAT family N-acetyltransferase [Rhodobacteraceae bacterium D3-12]|nr:GNAT family N-acetyltransferase [Rhodobacteraceae bacterium D3-12]